MLSVLEDIYNGVNEYISYSEVTSICDWIANEITTAPECNSDNDYRITGNFEIADIQEDNPTAQMLEVLSMNSATNRILKKMQDDDVSNEIVAKFVSAVLLFYGAMAAIYNKYKGKEFTAVINKTTYTIKLCALNFAAWARSTDIIGIFNFEAVPQTNQEKKVLSLQSNITMDTTDNDRFKVTLNDINTSVSIIYWDIRFKDSEFKHVKLSDINLNYFKRCIEQ